MAEPKRAITLRAILIGSLFVALICGITPFNDWILANTPMVGSYLPLCVVLLFFLLTIFGNGLLYRFAPGRALRASELAVIMTMSLIACSIPGQGLMRPFLPTLVSPLFYGRNYPHYWQNFLGMHLPTWLFPVKDLASAPSDPNVVDFYGRIQPGSVIPYSAWIIPLLGWGIFIAGLMTTLVAIAYLVRVQWTVNERLPFPVAQLELALIEDPKPGNYLNDLFRSRIFWIGLCGVFLIQGLSALHLYLPAYFPGVPLEYHLNDVLSSPPWAYLPTYVKNATLYFTFVAIAYFIPARTVFSLWAIYLIAHAYEMFAHQQVEISLAAWDDQHFGSCIAYVSAVLWIGRNYWRTIVREAPLVGFCAVLGTGVMLAWLILLGVHLLMALLIVGVILLAHIVVARVVAETGLPFFRSTVTPGQIFSLAPASAWSTRDLFFAGVFTINGGYTTREGLLTFAQHGLRVSDGAGIGSRERSKLAAVMAWSLVLGFIVCAASSLHCYYTYSAPLTQREQTLENPQALQTLPLEEIVGPVQSAGRPFPQKAHSPALNLSLGVGITLLLQLATWRFAWWPFLPVGYLACNTYYLHMAWFSLMIGWLVKVLILRFGGASFYQRWRPFFIGLIFGEALAAATVLVVNLILASRGLDYPPIRLLPT
jgi:hypothetical protein